MQGVGAQNLEPKRAPVFGQTIERATVRMGNGLGRQQDVLQQTVDIALPGERSANDVELLKPLEHVIH